jgi:hypothetical protein
MKIFFHAAACVLVLAEPVYANEAITCTYDTAVPLVQVVHSGSVNNGINFVWAGQG